MGDNPSHPNRSFFKGSDRLPVEDLYWDDAMEFCRRLSRSSGAAYGLPTEAQWEYACRAGSQAAFCFGGSEALLGEYAWYDDNSGNKTHEVGQKRPNAFGLYDMHGNVWEWCSAWDVSYGGDPRAGAPGLSTLEGLALRGGDWLMTPQYCRSAVRGKLFPGPGNFDPGFRVMRTPR